MQRKALPALAGPESRTVGIVSDTALPAPLAKAIEAAAAFAQAGQAGATRRAYASDFDHCAAWCSGVGLASLPARPETVASYLAHLAGAEGLKASTIARRVAAIADHHRRGAHEPNPTRATAVAEVMAGIRSTLGTRPAKKAALTADLIAKVLRKLPADTPIGLRDRALILIAFAAAPRRPGQCRLHAQRGGSFPPNRLVLASVQTASSRFMAETASLRRFTSRL